MLVGLLLGFSGILLLFGTKVGGYMISEQSIVPTDCYSIPESRPRLAAKDKLETLDLNFTEIGLKYLELYEELELISMKDFEYQEGKYVAMNCTLVDLCKTSRSVDGILDLNLPSYIGFLTIVVKLDAKNIVAYLFQNKSSVLINERDFGIFMLDGIKISLHSP